MTLDLSLFLTSDQVEALQSLVSVVETELETERHERIQQIERELQERRQEMMRSLLAQVLAGPSPLAAEEMVKPGSLAGGSDLVDDAIAVRGEERPAPRMGSAAPLAAEGAFQPSEKPESSVEPELPIAPPTGFLKSSEAARVLGISASMFSSHVRSGRIQPAGQYRGPSSPQVGNYFARQDVMALKSGGPAHRSPSVAPHTGDEQLPSSNERAQAALQDIQSFTAEEVEKARACLREGLKEGDYAFTGMVVAYRQMEGTWKHFPMGPLPAGYVAVLYLEKSEGKHPRRWVASQPITASAGLIGSVSEALKAEIDKGKIQ